jgi:putative transposase
MPFSTTQSARKPVDSLLAPFLQAEGLPFADVLTADDIQQACRDAGLSFGETAQAFWTPALTLWTFLSQVLHGGMKSCRAAVTRAFLAMALTRPLASLDTGNYCRARAKLPTALLKQLTLGIGDRLEEAAPQSWLWHKRNVTLVDGFTASMPDTPANQKEYPQPKTQKPGLGFPLLRAVILLSLATASARGLAVGPYQGKESGETALLRSLLDQLQAGTIVVADRFYCSYFMLAMLQSHGVDVVMRLHQKRKCDFRRGQRLGSKDHVVVWHKPARPKWMDAKTYESMPAELRVREVHKNVAKRGCRVKELTVITTLLDAELYPKENIEDLYHERWHVEIDIRSIKSTLQMEVLSCKSPEMILKEIWVHLLGYNLIRKVAAQAALLRGICPREISFAASQQVVLGSWSKLTEATESERVQLGFELLRVLGKEKVGDRPDRCEPRAKKRRPKKQKLLMKPRKEARAEILAGRAE